MAPTDTLLRYQRFCTCVSSTVPSPRSRQEGGHPGRIAGDLGAGVGAFSIFSHGFLCRSISIFICKLSLVKSEVLQRMVLFSRRCVFPWPNQFWSHKRLGVWQHDSRQTQPAGEVLSPRDRCLCSYKRGGRASLQKIIHAERKRRTANVVNMILSSYLSRCLEAFFKKTWIRFKCGYKPYKNMDLKGIKAKSMIWLCYQLRLCQSRETLSLAIGKTLAAE